MFLVVVVVSEYGSAYRGCTCGTATGSNWPLSRAPLLLETSVPGIFAVGNARSGSVKRVASAVGEGAMAVQLVHRFLAYSTERQNVLSH